MEKKLEYSFDDEVAKKFCYDIDNRKLEVHFSGYYDASSSQYIEKPCIWVIENWSDAKSKLSSENTYIDLEKNLGIISMILSVEVIGNSLALTINTIDNRYIDLVFYDPQLGLQY
ncbi:MAG: hypothetical protein J0L99_16830 [Chitinophagales bacterium]|nr:hypothetical protein [Chitinophagales bacterium]